MVVADFNGDGKPDIVTASSVNGTVSALLGNGDETMRKAVTSTASGQSACRFCVCDLMGTANSTWAVAAYDRNKVTFFSARDAPFNSNASCHRTGPASIALLPAANGYALVAAEILLSRCVCSSASKAGLSGRVVHRLAINRRRGPLRT